MASYEPWRWGYSDGDVFNGTTKKFQDDSGGGKHLTTVTGSPVYKTNILNGLAVARFSGSGQGVTGTFASSDPVTECMLVIPRAVGGGGFHAACAFHSGSGGQGSSQTGLNGTTNKAFGYPNVSPFATFDGTTTLVVGTAYVITAMYIGSGISRLRIAGVEENNLSTGSALPSRTSFSVGGAIPALGENLWQVDVVALAVYNANIIGSQTLTDAEAWLTQLKTTGSSTAYTDTLLPASYALTGQALKQGYGQTLSPASYALTGQDVTEVTGGGLLGGHGGAQWTPQPGGRR